MSLDATDLSVSEDRSRQPCEKHVDSVYGEGFSVIGYGNFTIGLVKGF